MKACKTMSQTYPPDEKTASSEPATNTPLLDPVAFETFAEAAKLAVAKGLTRRALVAHAPPSKAKH